MSLADNEDCAICGLKIPENQAPRLTFAAGPEPCIVWICRKCAGSNKTTKWQIVSLPRALPKSPK
jgi:hypothetical protein